MNVGGKGALPHQDSTWTSKSAQNNGPISQNREYRQYRVHSFGHFWISRQMVQAARHLKLEATGSSSLRGGDGIGNFGTTWIFLGCLLSACRFGGVHFRLQKYIFAFEVHFCLWGFGES